MHRMSDVMINPTLDNLETDHFIARKVGAYYEIVEKETGEVKETKVKLLLPRKRFNKPIRSKMEALNAVMEQELTILRAQNE